ncbi:nitrilase family protein [Arcicella sp. LKC2W]|uniref:nitrilase family protein n=1 Tax=Arcicella sp. LKC2W TaxID=2984198 RepID=UPI002B2075C3|nr:nitrilase family protein [Arcicella sp. LKC2W]MEA5458912.1 nitrilase family protein [Arcicella sp. LKC2W]
MQNLSVTLIQTDLFWENPTANLANLEEKIAQISSPTDLIILPEMFNTGFTMNVKSVAEPMNFTTFKWMKQQAKKANAVVTGSYIVKEGEICYNRLIWMRPDGSYETYDKRHLFRMGGENNNFSGGEKRLIVELKGWKICPLICYDLRFPVWSRQGMLEDREQSLEFRGESLDDRNSDVNSAPSSKLYPLSSNSYDLLIYVANWPAVRSKVWDTLLQARAIENLSYCIGVNRVGEDGMGLHYNGNSAIIDYKGNQTFYQTDSEVMCTQTLSKQDLDDFRTKFPAFLDADNFEIQ